MLFVVIEKTFTVCDYWSYWSHRHLKSVFWGNDQAGLLRGMFSCGSDIRNPTRCIFAFSEHKGLIFPIILSLTHNRSFVLYSMHVRWYIQVTVCEKIIFHKLYTSVPFSLRQNMVVLYCLFANIHMNYKEFWVTYVHNYKQITLLSISYARAHISLITLYSILINYYSYRYIPW